jgi:hypothetical protein
MRIVSAISQKLQSLKVLGIAFASFGAIIVAPGVASASPQYFDVPKPTEQRVCYKQLNNGVGWKQLGFKNLDHCLRYVSTPVPEDQDACEGGWWFVYGFHTEGQCRKWVTEHSGGYGGQAS